LADVTQLRRVLLNLAHNGAQACLALPAGDSRPRTVELGAHLSPGAGGTVELWVGDSGPGIADEVLPKIWTPFFTTRAQGTGLGLAFVREIVHDHGGRIDIMTGSSGTRFTITLPLASPEPSPGPSPARR
jgi:signal transduction histidine kinase